MNDKTIININIQNKQNAKKTIINTGLLDKGIMLCGKYIVERPLESVSGEADLYMCSYKNDKYIAKIYKRKEAIKQDVVDKLLQINSPYVAQLFDFSHYQGFPFEILPYYKNGSLQGKTYSYDNLVKKIIPNINEGLHVLHQAGIIHKDLKPSNIMISDDNKNVVIIDFGVSSVLSGESSIVVTQTGKTPVYAAPETSNRVFLVESDYYSFGITLFELFTGYTPYAEMSDEEIFQYQSVGRISFPNNMPLALSNFILALTYHDLTSRSNKENPNRRWRYEEVKNWLGGARLPIPGGRINKSSACTIPAYKFINESITDPSILAQKLADNWEEGKKHLFRGTLREYFRTSNDYIAKQCLAAEENIRKFNGQDDLIFLKLLYKINPALKKFYWKDRTFENIYAVGRDLLEHLWNNDKHYLKYYEPILSQKALSEYVSIVEPKNEILKKIVADMEYLYRLEKSRGTSLRRTFYLIAYTLSGQKILNIDGQKFYTVGQFADFMKEKLNESLETFKNMCAKLINADGNLDIQLEMWLIAIGKKKEIDEWRKLMNQDTEKEEALI
jgi:serine/threonine protein kinase